MAIKTAIKTECFENQQNLDVPKIVASLMLRIINNSIGEIRKVGLLSAEIEGSLDDCSNIP